jgi:hypothetical protein
VLRDLDTTRAEFRAGRVGVAQIHELARVGSNPRCRDQLAGSEQVLLDAAKALEFCDYRTVINRWEALADADGANSDTQATHENRNASLTESMGEFRLETSHGVIDGTVLRDIFQHFCDAEFRTDWQAAVDKHGDNVSPAVLERTARQRRADALVAIFEAAATSTHDATMPDPVVNMVIDLDTFEQYTREQTNGTPVDIDPATVRDRRCETTDGVPVDPRQVVALAFIGHVRRVVIDSAGVIVDAGRKRRLFTGAVRDAMQAIEPRCSWLGCSLRAAISQIDHLTPHTNGGTTNTANATIMCGRHNLHKHQHRYTARRATNGNWVLHRPDGTPMQPPDAEW